MGVADEGISLVCYGKRTGPPLCYIASSRLVSSRTLTIAGLLSQRGEGRGRCGGGFGERVDGVMESEGRV